MLISVVALLKFSAYEQNLLELRKELAVLQSQQQEISANTQQQLREFRAVLSESIEQQEAVLRTLPKAEARTPSSKRIIHTSRDNPPSSLKYSSFRAKDKVKVSQQDDGSLAVENNDPSLSGRSTIIEAVRADGTVDVIPITIPHSPKVSP